ncbi:uncharacterized protein JCM6883_007166 [Sporobolomyces salmoneus]|uniref:uncharacterized protein n=1 Tax=Sporobolomyces salmoneus TaxID=183962 RepID=UPI00316FC41A
MSAEVTQQAHSALEDLTLESQAVAKPSNVDPFSLLPPELLDWNYELAAARYRLSILPPSKLLHPHHQRACHNWINIDSSEKIVLFSRMLDSHPHLATFVKGISFSDYTSLSSLSRASMLDGLSKLPALTILRPPPGCPQLLEMVESGDNPGRYLANLKTCRLFKIEITSDLVKGLSLLPSLRRVEFNQSSLKVNSPFITANQVEEVVFDSERYASDPDSIVADPSSFLRFFPAAKIVSLDYAIRTRSQYDCLRKILPPLGPFLYSLRLSYYDPSVRDVPPIDFSEFTSLRELHLESPFTFDSSDLLKHPRPFPNLVSLSLEVTDLRPDILKLFRGPQRLRNLRYLALNYKCHEWSRVEIETAEAEVVQLETDHRNFDGILYKGWIRGVARAYLRGCSCVLRDARRLATLHNVPLPPLLIDLNPMPPKDKLEYYKVNMTTSIDMTGYVEEGEEEEECFTFNLRYRDGGEADSSLEGSQARDTSEG